MTALRVKLEAQAHMEHQEVIRQQQHHKSLESEYESTIKSLQSCKQELVKRKNEVAAAYKQLQIAKHQQTIQKSDLEQKDEIKAKKLNQIAQMEQEREDLFKLQQLLQQRVSDLKNQVAPRDDQITFTQQQIQEMDAELLKDLQQKKQAELQIFDYNQKKQSFEKSIAEKKTQIQEVEQNLKGLLLDLQQWCLFYQKNTGKTAQQVMQEKLVSFTTVQKSFIQALKVIYSKHIEDLKVDQKLTQEQKSQISQIIKEDLQQKTDSLYKRNYLEKSVQTLQKSLERRKLQLNAAIERARQQSSVLVGFSNLMRRENKEIQ